MFWRILSYTILIFSFVFVGTPSIWAAKGSQKRIKAKTIRVKNKKFAKSVVKKPNKKKVSKLAKKKSRITHKTKKKRAKKKQTIKARAKKKSRRKTKKKICRYKGKDRFPPIKLFHANANKRIKIRLFDRCGWPIAASERRLRSFLKCRRTKKKHAISWALLRKLYRVYRAFKQKEVIIYSGYRHRSVAQLKESYHTKGRALDMAIRGVHKRKLRDYLLKTGSTGVGYYPKLPFIHMDARKRSAFWIDFSASGQRSRYAKNAYALLRMERKGIPIREKRKVIVIIKEKESFSKIKRPIIVASRKKKKTDIKEISQTVQQIRNISVRPLIAPELVVPPLPSLPPLPEVESVAKSGQAHHSQGKI